MNRSQAQRRILLCLGSTFLCVGSLFLKKSKDHNEKEK